MSSIEFKKTDKSLTIIEDGSIVVEVAERSATTDELEFYSEDIDQRLLPKILSCELGDIPKGLHFYNVYACESFQLVDFMEVKRHADFLEVEFAVTFSWESWDNPILVGDFLELYASEITESGLESKVIDQLQDGWAAVNVVIYISAGNIQNKIDAAIDKCQMAYETLLLKISKEKAQDSIVKIFEFPKGYEVVCAQYLMWFGELLNSLDIQADVTTECRAGKTSLIIEPKMVELFSDIEKLLYQYLSLPYSEFLPADLRSMTALERSNYQILVNQVENYKLQIQMKESVIELKNATISNLNAELSSKNHELLLLKSLKNGEVEILEGAVSVGEFKWGALKVNVGKLLRLLK
ncbi:TPA: hypothetical protein ACN32H_004621 [Vibrio parahaemolyticus]|uniref:hypothetical protein n=2 Tax=Vibrio parahaemolyticus TaxID=670 RepID=UPI0012FAEDD7|nr:hypothetical protein [Vibrio parahaemolyticus]EHR7287178.1 hypothetical protein [Vibrio parahaemolyticus]EJG1806160.1 hypothetical protein [Vibrio parahaemolyticus]EJL7825013.1 hypothetical protein [Vibrio parahaemolyticus]EJM7150382.1 hypothetical protein [Vibrio parahaemolyticus]MUT59207.1 hypothetical protein [Vibrio parahaemolyticus]